MEFYLHTRCVHVRYKTMDDQFHQNVHYSIFFFNDTATTEIYTLSLHDALPIWSPPASPNPAGGSGRSGWSGSAPRTSPGPDRKSTRLNSSHANISYAVFCLKKKKTKTSCTILIITFTPATL